MKKRKPQMPKLTKAELDKQLKEILTCLRDDDGNAVQDKCSKLVFDQNLDLAVNNLKFLLADFAESVVGEEKKMAVIPDMGPGVPYEFMQGYGRGEATGFNQAISEMEQKSKELLGDE
jgi:hypothetical protein